MTPSPDDPRPEHPTWSSRLARVARVSAAGLALLAFAVAGALLRPRGVPAWLAPTIAVGLAFTFGTVDAPSARDAVDPLVEPLAFVAVAVPLAVLLDDLGLFSALAERAAGRRNLARSLWLLAAATTALLNLDAAIVLLTPLYVRVARGGRATTRSPSR